MSLTDIPYLPYAPAPAGVDMGAVVVIPTGGNVIYVRSTGPGDYDPPALTGRIVTSINTALLYCRSGFYDTVYVFPQHVESVSTAAFFSNLVAGVRIIGIGDGTSRPTLTWSATASTWLLNKANVLIDNMRLILAPTAGSVTVTAPITVSAAGVNIRRCYVEVGTTAARLCTTAITVAAGADDFSFVGNTMWGDVTAGVTDGLLVNAAVNRARILGNDIQVATSANGHGPVAFQTAAALDSQVKWNAIINKKAGSTNALLGMAGVTGVVADNYLGIQAATGGATGIGTPGNWNMFRNYGGVIAKQGIEITPQSG